MRHPVLYLQASYYDNEWSDYVRGASFRTFIEDHYTRFALTFDYEKNLPYRNIQMFMLGSQPRQSEDRQHVEHKGKYLNKDFDVVMFQEHMMESLVLLKHSLNWKYKDLVTFGTHPHPERYDLRELTADVNRTIIHYNEGWFGYYSNYAL